ncbi:PHP domain-containing protein [Verrucomicrobiota bacterium]
MIDLHVHSMFSDGSFTPEELVDKALDCGLTAMALTDHDSTAGIDRFLEACENKRLEGIPGVEISADAPQGTLHMLGYFLDHKNREFEKILQHIRGGREERNIKILNRLNELGLELTWEEVTSFAGDEVVGRPHFAQALVARKHVRGKKEAFDLYLARGKPAYEDRFRLQADDSIAAIVNAGGVAVLAHPFTLELEGDALLEYVGELADMGLQGIEGYYPEYSNKQCEEYLELAKRLDLAVTGGTDFHGAINPNIKLGTGFGSLRVPDDLVEELRNRQA